jgi:hypothetical protein
MENVSLHSNHLYHFKKDINILKLILQSGFQHRSWAETIPFFGLTQNNFMVCFTDLRISDSVYHRQCYGKNALVMKKSWARRNKISPVRYIHKDSVGMHKKYMHLKTLFRNAFEHKDTFHKLVSYLATSKMYLGNNLPQGDITLANTWGEKFIEEFESICKETENIIGSSKKIYDSFFTMFLMIQKLHNELESRDAYLRTYVEDFTCPASGEKHIGKILYDEREWRSIIFPNSTDLETDPKILDCIKKGFLPQEYNLKFSDDDVIAILVEQQNQKSEIINIITSNQTMLGVKSTKKIYLYDEYNQDDLNPSPSEEFTGEIHKIKFKK